MILPGWIDAHVHFNEPGRTHWEGLHTGSLALAAGGGTAFCDMPLNSSPPVTNLATFESKKQIALKKSHLDFGLWGALTADSLPNMEGMATAGAMGFKAFMCHSGLEEFPAASPKTLRQGMATAKSLNLPVAVHAEIAAPITVHGKDMAAWLASRPRKFELDAISLALELACETGAALHIVHVTCHEGIALVSTAKKQGIDVTVETCPHDSLLTDEDACRIGAFAKCAPPQRPAATVSSMWQKLRAGEIDTLGSDHSPSSPDLKESEDIFTIWGGIAGIQHGLPLLLEKQADLSALTSANVAERFRFPTKGKLEIGFDADFTVVTKNQNTIRAEDLLTRHPISPYLGFQPRLAIAATYLRGNKVDSHTKGQFLTPAPR